MQENNPGGREGVTFTVEDIRMALAAGDTRRVRKMLIELEQQTRALTKKDIQNWRQAWQMAINVDQPSRVALYDIYDDALIDLHLTGCIEQRKNKTLQKPFVLNNTKGAEDDAARLIFEREWFINFMSLGLDRRTFGHSLIELGDILQDENGLYFSNVKLVPRRHVIPEKGVIVREAGDDWRKGTPYREGKIADWCIEAGDPDDLGLLLKCAPQAISKKNMLGFWDTFGEIFGIPMRIGKTMSQDPKDVARIQDMLNTMGAASWGLFPEGTDIEIKESTRGDAFNVYDKRVDRCNSEISKGILNQTMTIDNGSSLSQSEVHLEIFEDVCAADARMIKFLVNGALIPKMINLGFPLQGVSFDWDEAVSFSPAEQREMERMLLDRYKIDKQYFIDKYKIPITDEREAPASSFFD